MAEINAVLTQEEFMSSRGCGAGTEGACYALSLQGADRTICTIAAGALQISRLLDTTVYHR